MVAQTQNNQPMETITKGEMEELTLTQLQLIIGDILHDAYYKTGYKASELLEAFEKKIREDEREFTLNELFQK